MVAKCIFLVHINAQLKAYWITFNDTFGLVELNLCGSEKFRPNGLCLVHNAFEPSIGLQMVDFG